MADQITAHQFGPNTSQGLKRLYTSAVAGIAAISGFLFGFDTAVINGALVYLRKQFALTDILTEAAASSLLLGCLLGAAVAGLAGDRLGRRSSMIVAAVFFGTSAIGSALAGNIVQFCLARITGGLAIGLASALAPVYISEISPPSCRGLLVSLNQLAIVIGVMVAYFTNWQLAALGDGSWRWMFAVATVPTAFFLAGLLFIPESPRWLITVGRQAEGREVLAKIAGQREAQIELAAIEFAIAEEKSAYPGELFAPGMRKCLLIAVSLAILQQITGINTVLYYGSVLYTEHFHGGSGRDALGANLGVGAVNLIGTCIAMTFIDRWGRRALFLTASGGMAVSLLALSLGLHFPSTPPVVIFASVLLYVSFFAVGLGPGVWVYITEIFPTRIRGRATSLATTTLWAACLLVTLTFLSIVRNMGAPTAFSIYAGMSVITFCFVWKWVPETCGRSLEEIQKIWRR